MIIQVLFAEIYTYEIKIQLVRSVLLIKKFANYGMGESYAFLLPYSKGRSFVSFNYRMAESYAFLFPFSKGLLRKMTEVSGISDLKS